MESLWATDSSKRGKVGKLEETAPYTAARRWFCSIFTAVFIRLKT